MGKTAVHAIQGGLMHFLPGMEGVSMEKPFVDCMRDLWAMFEGSSMLTLNHSQLLAAAERLKRSSYARLQATVGKFWKKTTNKFNICLYLTFMLSFS